jgi:serine incorporator 1/3
MIVTSCYMCCLITNWGEPAFDESIINSYKPSKTSYWVKIIISYIASILYIWTLIAPKILTNRKFD